MTTATYSRPYKGSEKHTFRKIIKLIRSTENGIRYSQPAWDLVRDLEKALERGTTITRYLKEA